jgi:hypothetical protein
VPAASLSAVQLKWFLSLASAVLLVVALTVVLHDKLDSGDDSTTATTVPGDTSITTSGAPGATVVNGTVTAVHLTGAVLDPRVLPAPFTMTATRGFGNGAQLPNVRVNGAISNISWDGGRPFVLTAGPGVQLDPVNVDLTPDGFRLLLGDTASTFLPGTYQLDTPVAVGGASTTPVEKDRVTFTVRDGDGAQLQPTGDANVVLSRDGAVHLKGPGSVHLEGDVVVTVDGKKHSAKRLDLRVGPYDLVFTPASKGGWFVAGEVQDQGGNDLQLGAPARSGRRVEVR